MKIRKAGLLSLVAFVLSFAMCVSFFGSKIFPKFPFEAVAYAAGNHEEQLLVYIFDVGQADCILIKSNEYSILIDAGNIGQDDLILEYLEDCSVKSLDMLVVTHPHSDHIGSMAAVIRGMDAIETLLMPDVIHTTATFERLLDAIEEKEIEVTIPQSGDIYEFGDIIIEILAPNSSAYSNLNNYSIVMRVVYGSTAFLFTGDAEALSENEQLDKGYGLNADVLKVGHHGSHSSSTENYLDTISPSYAVISCGKDNSYGHPHKEIMSRLTSRNITILRTDENGTIVFSSNGNVVTVSQGDLAEAELAVYIGNLNSRIFHLSTCSSLPADKNRIFFSGRDEAINNKYQPCKRCKP